MHHDLLAQLNAEICEHQSILGLAPGTAFAQRPPAWRDFEDSGGAKRRIPFAPPVRLYRWGGFCVQVVRDSDETVWSIKFVWFHVSGPKSGELLRAFQAFRSMRKEDVPAVATRYAPFCSEDQTCYRFRACDWIFDEPSGELAVVYLGREDVD